ncbi:AAC(3) family N-acetyltransferase [Selenomonas sp.]|uniref:AAC(3) family N-acetyltransferase n=1 Tax=Selenomonas sp. TaxID=2053611 RepID=UPI0025FF80B3|nr:AAC(3) family N-acetyltransferase [Selenomonas sp.]MCI6284134.1 AAC(3) family N-acetyltransferase [Selenomonas sp.]
MTTQEQLFKGSDGAWVTPQSMEQALRAVGADKADVLFIHTDLTFGLPDMTRSRSELVAGMMKAVLALGAGTVCVPTFTFSFPNGRAYDVKKSRSRMGAFNEYLRKQPEAVRSVDPLLSVALLGDKRYLVTDVGHESIGKGCTFDLLHREQGTVKFVFLGTRPALCFTYTHYMEHAFGVPYRYNRPFTGQITTTDGRTYEDTYQLFVRYQGVEPTSRDDFEQLLLKTGACRKGSCGDSFVYCVEESAAYELFMKQLRKNINYILECPYPETLDDTFAVTGEMVAL